MRKDTSAENSMSFDIENYEDEAELFQDVAKVMQVLVTNDYECAFRYEDTGIYVLEYAPDNPELGCPMIYWLDQDQLDCLYTSNYIDSEEK